MATFAKYKTFLLPVLVFVLVGLAPAGGRETMGEDQKIYHQQNWSDEQKQVWAVIEQLDRAFAANDPGAYFKLIGDEITVIVPSSPYRSEGKPDDMEEFKFLLNAGITKVGLFQEMQPYVFVGGDVAFVTFYARAFFEASGKMKFWKITDVLEKTDAGWKFIHIHVSE